MRPMNKKKKHNASLSPTISDLSSWSHLPPELLEQIFALLSPSDRHRFRLICSPWRSVARQFIPPFPLPFEPPRLLLSRPDNVVSFYDLFNSKSLSYSLPAPHRQARCFGYLAGWFFLVSHQNPSRACLFNPVLVTEIPLPDLEFPIKKAILSAPPGFPNCVVAVMGRSASALCEVAGKRWQVLDLGQRLFDDIIFWRNQLCGIENRGNVLICNFDMESRRTSLVTVQLPRQWKYSEVYLVESTGGDLLTVMKDYRMFWVYKLDQQCTWEQMEQIGDQALFLGVIRSESVPVNRFLGSGLRENSIYLASRKFERPFGLAVIYSMEDESMTAAPLSGQHSVLADPVWISPVIWP
ncbi:F-box protein At2g05970-like [Carex rostrata]